ncbi:MAG TPA: group 1 truncated hemoglobin [Gemmatimonadaceae bacterium]|nr:group 1 truncated hemoglobin [Gemmatimonadaceae bacterium]
MICLTRVIGAVAVATCSLLAACGGGEQGAADTAADSPAAAPAANTLYDRLGGRDAIVAVVDSFVARVAADQRINGFFTAAASDPARLASFKAKLVDQICQASGGPCTYTGKDMKSAHAGMKITNAHFDALVEDLVATLKAFNVAQADQDALLGVLGPMRPDIVTSS